jgi:hypothetical protein
MPNKRLPQPPLRSNDPTKRTKINVFRAPYNGPPVVLELPIEVAIDVLSALEEFQANRRNDGMEQVAHVQETIDALTPYVDRP